MLTSCVDLGQVTDLSVPHFLICQFGTSYITCGTQCKMKVQGPCFGNHEGFRNGPSRACHQASDCVGHKPLGPWAPPGSSSFAFSLSPSFHMCPGPQRGKKVVFPLPISPFTIFLYHWLGARDVGFVCPAWGCSLRTWNTRSGPTKCLLNGQWHE